MGMSASLRMMKRALRGSSRALLMSRFIASTMLRLPQKTGLLATCLFCMPGHTSGACT